MKQLIPSFLILGLLVALISVDQILGLGVTLYLLRKLAALIEYVSFWR